MKALIVEDEGLTREYLTTLLEREFEFDEVLQAADGEEALELCLANEIKFFMIDLIIPKLDGVKLAHRILEHGQGKMILALSSECDDFTFKEVYYSRILGYIDKLAMTEAILIEAIQVVLSGRVYLSADVRKVMDRLGEDSDAYYKILSDRELQVLRLLAKCRTDEGIGEELGISPYTARRHRVNVMNKLNLETVAQLVQYALDKGIIKHKGGIGWT